jgi:hypothetical protein
LWPFCVCPREREPDGGRHAWVDLSHRPDRRNSFHPLTLWPALACHDIRSSRASAHGCTPAGPPRLPRGANSLSRMGPIVAGSIAAAALALVLHAFAIAIGLSVSSQARAALKFDRRHQARSTADGPRSLAALFAFPIRRLAKNARPEHDPERLCALGLKQLSKLAGREDSSYVPGTRFCTCALRFAGFNSIRHSGALTTQMDQETKMPIWTKFALSVAIVLGTAATRARAGEGAASTLCIGFVQARSESCVPRAIAKSRAGPTHSTRDPRLCRPCAPSPRPNA